MSKRPRRRGTSDGLALDQVRYRASKRCRSSWDVFARDRREPFLYPWSGMVRRSGGQGNNILSAVFRQNHAYHSVIQLLRKRNRIQKKNLLRWGRWSRIYQWRVAPRCLSIFLLKLHLRTESKTASSYIWSSSAQIQCQCRESWASSRRRP